MASLNDIASNIAEVLSYNPAEPLLFSSGTFWALFLGFLPLYSLLRKRWTQMAVFVLAFSFYFYYRCSGVFVLLLAGTSLVDWLLSRLIARPGSGPTLRRTALVVSLLCSLGILAYFKYANFFLWNINATVGSNFQPLDLILPVGISFYTFQSVSYIVDVYKGRVAPTRTWLEYAFFLAFFPALVAGPIVRADYFLPQIRRNTTATREETFTGFWLIILGVVKKAVIADYIAQYNDLIFQTPGGYNGFETLMGIAGYTMQIYCDFSGYSDMAIGIALISWVSNLPKTSISPTRAATSPISGTAGTYRCLPGCAITSTSLSAATAKEQHAHMPTTSPPCSLADSGMERPGNSCSGARCTVPDWLSTRQPVRGLAGSGTPGL